MEFIKKFLSRKFIVTILTTLLMPWLLAHGMPQEDALGLIGFIATYLVSQGYVDGQAEKAKSIGTDK